jgi:uncharacterized membrane protein YadS
MDKAADRLAAAPSESKRDILHYVPGIALSAALAALGLTRHLSAIPNAGIKPRLLEGVLFV